MTRPGYHRDGSYPTQYLTSPEPFFDPGQLQPLMQITPDNPPQQPTMGGYPAGESHMSQWGGVEEPTQPVTPITPWLNEGPVERMVRKPRWVRKPVRAYRELVIDAVWTCVLAGAGAAAVFMVGAAILAWRLVL